MNWADVIARVLAALAAVVSCRVALVDRRHAPVAFALVAAWGIDLARLLTLPPRVDFALLVALPALSLWCAQWVLVRELCLCLWAMFDWCLFYLFCEPSGKSAFVSSVIWQTVVAFMWASKGGERSVATRCVIVLLFGDVAALLGPLAFGGPWWPVNLQSAATSCFLLALCAHAIRRERACA